MLDRHVCCLYENETEKARASADFIRVGLARGSKCVYVAGDRGETQAANELRSSGLDVTRLLAAGALLITTPRMLGLRRDAMDAYRLFSFWKSARRRAKEQRFEGLAGMGETGALLGGSVPAESWIEYENTLSDMAGHENCTFLCQYDRRFSTAAQIRQVLSTHTSVLHPGEEAPERPLPALRAAQLRLAQLTRNVNFGALAGALTEDLGLSITSIAAQNAAIARALQGERPDVASATAALRQSMEATRQAEFLLARVRSLARKPLRQEEVFDLNEAIEEVIALAIDEIAGRGIRMRRELADDLPVLRADRSQIQYVLLQLLTNAWQAIDAAPHGRREILLRSGSRDGYAGVMVRDSALGLSGASLQRMFEPFYTSKAGALGLGLFTSRELIRTHGGELWASCSESGSETALQFTLPLARQA
jgi:C4-dicarboxylate-specific signal transduction histidine kinase